jgi:hypothetical protein
MEQVGRKALLAVGPLAALGLWMQLLHVAVNVSYVYRHENYESLQPRYDFLFIPEISQVVTHWRALQAGDFRVDIWLVNVYRMFGWERMAIVALPLLAAVVAGVWMLYRQVAAVEWPMRPSVDATMCYRRRCIVVLLSAVWLVTGVGMAVGHRARTSAAGPADVGAAMQAGLDALYKERRPDVAVERFPEVLRRNPAHYGATFQLAAALDAAGKAADARAVWKTVLGMAEAYGDKSTADFARARLSGR